MNREQRRWHHRHEHQGQPERAGHQRGSVCEECGTALHKTHNYLSYGNLCRVCWLRSPSGLDGMASQ